VAISRRFSPGEQSLARAQGEYQTELQQSCVVISAEI
jgi:hypothetical protein